MCRQESCWFLNSGFVHTRRVKSQNPDLLNIYKHQSIAANIARFLCLPELTNISRLYKMYSVVTCLHSGLICKTNLILTDPTGTCQSPSTLFYLTVCIVFVSYINTELHTMERHLYIDF